MLSTHNPTYNSIKAAVRERAIFQWDFGRFDLKTMALPSTVKRETSIRNRIFDSIVFDALTDKHITFNILHIIVQDANPRQRQDVLHRRGYSNISAEFILLLLL